MKAESQRQAYGGEPYLLSYFDTSKGEQNVDWKPVFVSQTVNTAQ